MKPSRAPSILFVHAGAELYGADRILLELVAGLLAKGFQGHVVLPGPGPLQAELEKLGVVVHRKNLGVLRRKYFTPLGLLNRLCRMLTAVRFLRRLIAALDIDVVHSNTTAVFPGIVAARLAGVPHVWHVHEITTRPRWFARAIAACVGWLSHCTVFVSEAALEHMCRLSPRVRRHAVVVRNGIDTQRVVNAAPGVLRAELGWSAAQPVVGMVGRINWWKGQAKLVEAAALLAPKHPGLRFLLVGGAFQGEVRVKESLLASIGRLSLQGVVEVVDFREDVANVLADLDVFVLPSTEPDPFPTVVLEAMAAALPVVAFRHGGVCEMVLDGATGRLCTPCDATELAQAIDTLLQSENSRLRMGHTGRERLHSLFSKQAFIDRFAALYLGLLTGRDASRAALGRNA